MYCHALKDVLKKCYDSYMESANFRQSTVPKKLFNDKKVQICSCQQCPSLFSNLIQVVHIYSETVELDKVQEIVSC